MEELIKKQIELEIEIAEIDIKLYAVKMLEHQLKRDIADMKRRLEDARR